MTKVVISLGGNIARLDTAIKLTKDTPGSFLIVSSEGDPAACLQKIKEANLDPSHVSLDYTAWDTVTNFTNTKRIVESLNPDELMVVTDGFHMLRAMTIGKLVYFASKIQVSAHPSSPKDHDESMKLVVWDGIRAAISRFLGNTIYDQKVYDERMPYYFDCYYVARKLQGG